jgi:hypothetical protein
MLVSPSSLYSFLLFAFSSLCQPTLLSGSSSAYNLCILTSPIFSSTLEITHDQSCDLAHVLSLACEIVGLSTTCVLLLCRPTSEQRGAPEKKAEECDGSCIFQALGNLPIGNGCKFGPACARI